MLEGIRRELKQNIGHSVEICTKKEEKICGILSWVSPDSSMAEITLKDGQIKTVTDIQIKTIKDMK